MAEPVHSQSIPDLLRSRLNEARVNAGLEASDIDDALNLGAGWTAAMESGQLDLTLDMVLALSSILKISPEVLFGDLPKSLRADPLRRDLHAVQKDEDLEVFFPYGGTTASYLLPAATFKEFETVLALLRRGLKDTTRKTIGVVKSYQKAMTLWPQANPSDVWAFIIAKAYCDEYNHPASEVGGGKSVTQSWKRTGGRALEQFIVEHYKNALATKGFKLEINASRKLELLQSSELLKSSEVNLDKVDLVLSRDGKFAGVVHVKTSFAERRTDDVPLSRVILEAGGLSLFWTLDLKSIPSAAPFNAGELGSTWHPGSKLPDLRSDKRKDFEDRGEFSACFSYNTNTKKTPKELKNPKAKVYSSKMVAPELDPFTTFIFNQDYSHIVTP